MKRIAKLLFITVLFVVPIVGCTPPASTIKETKLIVDPVASDTMLDEARNIAGSVVESTDPLTIDFPTLFQDGAAIPFPEGSETLPQIAAYLKNHPGTWILFVGAYSPDSERYAQRLASARSAVVKRYLERQGVDIGEIEIIETINRIPLKIKRISIE